MNKIQLCSNEDLAAMIYSTERPSIEPGWGDGEGSGYGFGDGYGWGDGYGDGDGDGDGHGWGDGPPPPGRSGVSAGRSGGSGEG